MGRELVFCCLWVVATCIYVCQARSYRLDTEVPQLFKRRVQNQSLSTNEMSFSERINQAQRAFRILDTRPSRDCRAKYGTDIPMYYCPTPSPDNVLDWTCVRELQLCNGIPDCPLGEDEDPTMCMFHLAYRDEIKQLKELIIDFMLKIPGNNDFEATVIRPESGENDRQGTS